MTRDARGYATRRSATFGIGAMALLLLAGALSCGATDAGAQPSPTPDPTLTALNKEMLTQQIEQLRSQNDPLSFILRAITPIAVPVIAVIAGGWQWLQQRETERAKRDEDRFQTVVAGLGSDVMQAKIVASVMLRTFLQPSYEKFYVNAFDLVVGSLRCLHPRDDSPEVRALRDALTTSFKDAFPKARDQWIAQQKSQSQEQSLDLFDKIRPLDATNLPLDGAFFLGVDLDHVFMPGASLRGTDLSEARLRGAQLWGASANGGNVKLGRANLEGANLGNVDFSAANNGHASDLRNANLTGAKLWAARLDGANLGQAILARAQLFGDTLGSGADLRSAALTDANLRGAKLWDVDLRGADLRGADLSGARMDDATDLRGANLAGARFNANPIDFTDVEGRSGFIAPTVWPTNFEPVGAIRI